MALAAMIKKDSYRDSLKLTKEKKEILRKAIGSVIISKFPIVTIIYLLFYKCLVNPPCSL